jgi:FlaA1/EpsC-like NDP-sugar epimerase
MAVRFGNVLGSTGSVIPLFKQQIQNGGPVTVTHPEVQRFFMTISESCQLILQAAAMGRGGEIFILDMGKAIKIDDMARDLIRLSGLEPGVDIEITYTGLRPGEKLSEELTSEDEHSLPTFHDKIMQVMGTRCDIQLLTRQIEALRRYAQEHNRNPLIDRLREIVKGND